MRKNNSPRYFKLNCKDRQILILYNITLSVKPINEHIYQTEYFCYLGNIYFRIIKK